MNDCAGTPNRYFNSKVSELEKDFKKIADQIVTLRLTE